MPEKKKKERQKNDNDSWHESGLIKKVIWMNLVLVAVFWNSFYCVADD